MHQLAQVQTPKDLFDVLFLFAGILESLFPILIGFALLVFIWGLVKFIYNSGDTKTHAEGRKFMIWSLIAIFIMVSFMGILSFFYSDFGFSRHLGLPVLPTDVHPTGQL